MATRSSSSGDELSSPQFNATPESANNRSSRGNRKRSAMTDDDVLDGAANITPAPAPAPATATATTAATAAATASSPPPAQARETRTPSSPVRQPASSIPSSSGGSRFADPASMSMSMSTQNARAGPRQFGRRPAAAGSTRVAIAAPTTPHAIRAMEERRRVRMTPSREKRRASGRGAERGSPMDILRALAGVISVPKMGLFAGGGDEEEEEGEGEEEEDDEEELPSMDESEESDGIAKPPRLSLPMNEMRPDGDDDDEDDTGIFRPPEISRIDDEDLTVKSVEFARRAEVDASMVLGGGRRRDSDFFDPLDFGRGFEMGQNQSPSFVIGDQTLFAGVDAGDDTIDLEMLRQNEISSRPVIERDIDFADSTFRFDIPQDLTESESDQNEAEDDDQEGEEDAMAVNLDQGLSANVPELEDEGSGPEDFGSLSVSENETDQIEVPIDGDANLGAFLDDDIEEEYAQEEVAGDVAISRELEDQYRANEAIVQLQTRPMIQSKLALDDTAEILSEAEKEEEEVLAPWPFPSKSTIRTISKPKSTVLQTRTRASKPVMMSKLGQKVPSLPVGVIKTLADSFLPHSGKSSKKTKKDTVAALVQATDWFFEQAAEDLDAYSKHADREIIEESDVVALMRRQRVLGTGAKSTQGNRGAAPGSSRATLFSLAQRFLPRELITELRMDPPPDERRKKRRKISEGGELI